MGIKHTSHARYELWYHVAWGTKYRKKIFKNEVTKVEVGNLVHLTLSAPPRIAPSQAIQILKSVSTKLMFRKYKFLKQYYWGGEIWVAGYFIRSCGSGLTKESINKYIEEQSEEN